MTTQEIQQYIDEVMKANFENLSSESGEMMTSEGGDGRFMGNEGLTIHVPTGDYNISLEAASYLDQEEANQIANELDEPLRNPITNKNKDPQFNYIVSFLAQIKEQKGQLYCFKMSSTVKKLSQGKRKYGMFDHITAWKN